MGTESLNSLIDLYLDKRGGFTLTELKFINVNIYDSENFYKLLQNLKLDFKLQNLSLSKLSLDQRQIEIIIDFLNQKPYTLREFDISYNKIQNL